MLEVKGLQCVIHRMISRLKEYNTLPDGGDGSGRKLHCNGSLEADGNTFFHVQYSGADGLAQKAENK